MPLQLHDFEPVLQALKRIKDPPHSWVGGQAIIVWANRYLLPEQIEQLGFEIPLKSKDGDLRASETVARFVADALGGTVQPYRLKDPTRGAACGLIVKLNGAEVLIDVLEKLPGVPEAEPGYVIEIRAGLADKTLTAKVLDPVSLLFSKADVWRREQNHQVEMENGVVLKPGRYDGKHMELLCLVLPYYFTELEKWEQRGTTMRTTLAAEHNRLRRFLDAKPPLPPAIANSLGKVCSASPTPGSTQQPMVAVKSSGPLPNAELPPVPESGRKAETTGQESADINAPRSKGPPHDDLPQI